MNFKSLQFSHWAAIALAAGLLACIGGMIYVSYFAPVNIDDISVHTLPNPEAPFTPPDDLQVSLGDKLDQIWASSVWIGREVAPGVTRFVGSGWVIGNQDGLAYISTCAHVATYEPDLPLKVAYLGRSGVWSEIVAKEVGRYDTRARGDVAILSVEATLTPIKFANNQSTFTVGDEVFIVGVQHVAPPAIIATGIVSAMDRKGHEFQVKGWGWHGFSGGPIVLRKTGEVIGYLAWSVKGHSNDAMKSDCADLTHFMTLLRELKLEGVVQE